METELQAGPQKVRFDREATLALYRDTIKAGGADGCSCLSCRNFAAQRAVAYPGDFLELLSHLGADPLKEWEAFDNDFGPWDPARRVYGGWFLLCGEIIEDFEGQWVEEPFSCHFTNSFPNATLPTGARVCAVEFLTAIPWVLPESLA